MQDKLWTYAMQDERNHLREPLRFEEKRSEGKGQNKAEAIQRSTRGGFLRLPLSKRIQGTQQTGRGSWC